MKIATTLVNYRIRKMLLAAANASMVAPARSNADWGVYVVDNNSGDDRVNMLSNTKSTLSVVSVQLVET